MLQFNQLSFWEKERYLNKIDFLIVGSGIVGLSTAIHIKKKHPKKKICILERGYLPSGASTKNAGFACIGSASEILDDLHGTPESEVFATVEKRWRGLNYLRSLLGDSFIDYQSNGSHELFRLHEKSIYHDCLDQLSNLNQKLFDITGIQSVYAPASEKCKDAGFYGFNHSISNAAEGQIDTGKMMQKLLQLAHSLGIQLMNGIEVKSIEERHLITNYGKIRFEKLGICTNGLAQKLLPNENIQPARAQVIISSPIEHLKFKGIFHFDKGYYYFRNIGNRILLGGGRNLDFKAEETDELNTSDQIINHLSNLLESYILPSSAFTIEHHWAGTMGVGKTKSPIVKQLDKHSYCGVRLGGMGVAIGTLVGQELAEMMH